VADWNTKLTKPLRSQVIPSEQSDQPNCATSCTRCCNQAVQRRRASPAIRHRSRRYWGGGGGVACGCHLDCLRHLPEDSSIRIVRMNVLGTVPGVDVMAKGAQGWVQCEDHLPYYKYNSCSLPRPHDRDYPRPRLARTSAGTPEVQGPLEWGSCGFNAARGRCSGQLRSK
jgi:hypothetical protein